MYSTNIRHRVSTYDRMRMDKEKVEQLMAKSREMKARLKAKASGKLPSQSISTFERSAGFSSPHRAKSPSRPQLDVSNIDSRNFT